MLRKPNSIPSSDILIEDPVMEPFFISINSTGGYTVYERVTKGENNTEYIKTICYPGTFNHALKVVAREKLNSGDQKSYGLSEYVDRWEGIQKELSKVTTIDV